MKIVFFGTPDYVLPILRAIHKKFASRRGDSPIAAVVTSSPKPVGRKQILTYSPVDKWAHDHKLPIFYKSKDLITEKIDADLGILASYGEIISPEVINLFPKGILVIHPSLLPKYRGASPVSAAIINGEKETGITIFKMDDKLDHGPIISQFRENIYADDTGESLRNRLFEKSANLLIELIDAYLKNKISLKVQDDSKATFTKIIKKENGKVDLSKESPDEIIRKLRAFYPWPGIWTVVGGKRLKILKAHIENEKLILDEVQLEGKKPVSWKQFKEAYPNLK